MKKVLLVLIILLLAGLVLAGSFYFFKYPKSNPQKAISANSTSQPKSEVKNTESESTADKSVPAMKSAKILFLGDLMLDRYIRQVTEKNGVDFVFAKMGNFLSDSDLAVANLEGPITNQNSVSINSEFGAHNNYIFTFDKNILPALKKYKINLVNIGNNHILNFRESGLIETKNNLKMADIGYFGAPDEESNFIVKEIGGWKIAFVNYNQFVANPAEKTLSGIKSAQLSKPDLIIIYAHWDKEYSLTTSQKTKDLAHGFIDAGADLVIGSHPHVIQPKEEYKGKLIYYSLGNFVFDQYFNPDAMKGLAVEVTIDGNKKLSFQDHLLQIAKNGQTTVSN